MNADPHSLHRRAWDALPWVVAGAASAADRELVDAHLPDCPECQAEWAFQRQVQEGLLAGDPGPAQRPPPERGWQALRARIEAASEAAPEAQPLPLHAPPAPRRWNHWLAAAVLVQAVGLGGLSLALVARQQAEPGGAFVTLSQARADGAATVRVVPQPSLSFEALRRLLAQHELLVVEAAADGASLGLRPRHPATVDRAQLVAQLRASGALLLAEPIGAWALK
jgi:hypothetical protein